MPNINIKLFVALLSLILFVNTNASRAGESMQAFVPHAEKVGEAKMRVMLWDVYHATLFAPNGEWSFDKPFALQLEYLRNLHGDKIADRSVQEIRGQGFVDEVKLAAWHTQLRNIFPDVSEGDIINGVYTQNGETIFFLNTQEIGRIKDSEFSQHFFSIWLSPKASDPDFRLSLLGDTTARVKR